MSSVASAGRRVGSIMLALGIWLPCVPRTAHAQTAKDSAEKLDRSASSVFSAQSTRGWHAATVLWTEAATQYERANLPLRRADMLDSAAYVWYLRGELDSAETFYRQAAALQRASSGTRGLALSSNGLALVYMQRAETQSDKTLLDSAVAFGRIARRGFRAAKDVVGERDMGSVLGDIFVRLGKPDSAIASYRIALRIDRARGTRWASVRTLGLIAQQFREKRNGCGTRSRCLDQMLDSTMQSLQEAATIARHATVGTHEPSQGDMMRWLANQMSAVGFETFQRASLVMYEEAAKASRLFGDLRGEATALDDAGVAAGSLHWDVRGKFWWAKQDATKDSLRPIVAELKRVQLDLLRRALTIRRAIGDSGLVATSLFHIGRAHMSQQYGEQDVPDSVLNNLREALAIQSARGDFAAQAQIAEEIAQHFGPADNGQPNRNRDSVRIYHEMRGQAELLASRSIADSLAAVRRMLFDTWRDDSIAPDIRAISLIKVRARLEASVGDLEELVAAQISIANLYRGRSQLDSALTYSRAALAILFERLPSSARVDSSVHAILSAPAPRIYNTYRLGGSTDPRDRRVAALAAQARAHQGLGRVDSAAYYFKWAIASSQYDVDEQTALIAALGRLYGRVAARPDSALRYLGRALPLQHVLLKNRHITGFDQILEDMGQSMLDVARALNDLGRPREALDTIASAADALNGLYGGGFEGQSRAAVRASLEEAMGDSYARLPARDSALVHYLNASSEWSIAGDALGLSHTLYRIAAFHRATGGSQGLKLASEYYDSAATALATATGRVGEDANRIVVAERDATLFSEWAATLVARGDTYAALAAAERGRAQGLRALLASGQRADATVAPESAKVDLATEAHGLLAPLRARRAALLYYSVGTDSLTTWLLTRDGAVTLAARVGISRDSLATLVAALRAGLGADEVRGGAAISTGPTPRIATDSAARMLAQVLIPHDLAARVPAGTELIVVPHGVLGLVPFAALPMPVALSEDTVPLGIRYALRYAPSLRSVAAAEARPSPFSVESPRALALIVGNPRMPVPTLKQQDWMQREADTVGAQLRAAGIPATILEDTAATETAVRRALPTASLVHLATHGVAFGSERLVRSSYVALAPDRAHNGLLTVGALLDDVPPLVAELVVLSACQTGLGQLTQEEGTVGFQRALLARGARSVLVSLWSVESPAAGALIARFYAHWLGPTGPAMSKAEALRRAQQDLRTGGDVPGWQSRWADPLYWAAFQLVGAG
ncbi:MAG: hypothetical protein JWM95_2639 [Gemmatimonadetes bacterium]|nr:hypothetical protein [Gemmatimonadota bacterium]